MSKYPGSRPASNLKLQDAFVEDLEFPVDRDFLSVPPRLDPHVMLRRIEQTMPWRSARPGELDRRLAGKIDVEFTL